MFLNFGFGGSAASEISAAGNFLPAGRGLRNTELNYKGHNYYAARLQLCLGSLERPHINFGP